LICESDAANFLISVLSLTAPDSIGGNIFGHALPGQGWAILYACLVVFTSSSWYLPVFFVVIHICILAIRWNNVATSVQKRSRDKEQIHTELDELIPATRKISTTLQFPILGIMAFDLGIVALLLVTVLAESCEARKDHSNLSIGW